MPVWRLVLCLSRMDKFLYKNIINARKDSSTGNIFIDSFVYEIEEIDKENIVKSHP